MSQRIPIDKILPNPEQPRTYFDAAELRDLAQSIRENDIILPLVVEPAGHGLYILHDGERRLRAAKLAGLESVPCEVGKPLGDAGATDRLMRALVANVQRADLGPIEEGRAYARLRDEMGLTNNQIAIRVGVNVARVTHRLRLLELDQPIQELVETRKLSKDLRLVEALLGIPDSQARVKLATRLAEHRTTVNGGVQAAANLKAHLEAEQIADGIPAVRVAIKRAGQPERHTWDIWTQVGRLPPWILVEIAAREICETCSLRDLASEVTCRECPAVTLLVKMIGRTNGGMKK